MWRFRPKTPRFGVHAFCFGITNHFINEGFPQSKVVMAYNDSRNNMRAAISFRFLTFRGKTYELSKRGDRSGTIVIVLGHSVSR